MLAVSARTRTIARDTADGMRIASTALSMAEELGLDELRAHALATIGLAKGGLGDASAGRRDMERALGIALEIDSSVASAIVGNLAVDATFEGRLARTEELYAEALRLAQRFGDGATVRFIRANQIWVGFMRGNWDSGLDGAGSFIAECEAGSPHTMEANLRLIRGTIRGARGDSDGALADHMRAVVLARESNDPNQRVGTLTICATTHARNAGTTTRQRRSSRSCYRFSVSTVRTER